ncbi:MAG TPA: alkaline phosphatase D family protein [Actinomycetota bacterium]|nr:alkaline phosphatase D family protein [Actinomycetota bacterium]
MFPTGGPILPGGHPHSGGSDIDRRTFLKAAGGSAAALAFLGGCENDPLPPDPHRGAATFADKFSTDGPGWGSRWVNVRYEGPLSVQSGRGVVEVEPAVAKALQEGKEVAEYMARPVIAPALDLASVTILATVEPEGPVEAGLICNVTYEEGYAALLRDGELLLYRYDVVDRKLLAKKRVAGGPPFRLALTFHEGVVGAQVFAVDPQQDVILDVRDPDPLPRGFAGVLVNPASTTEGGRAFFSDVHIDGIGNDTTPRFAYRFAGAVEQTKTRVTARTEVPMAVAFEYSVNEDFSGSTMTPSRRPEGKLGSVHRWLEDLEPDTLYHWRPLAVRDGERFPGRPATFRTPPPSGAAVRFAYGCCTSGRITAYPSFEQARRLEPAFYLHSGDWGYADLTCVARRGDHFQARWMRMLREENIARMLDQTPLMFWQDDHDYQGDNGWSETVQEYAVTAFDELHANPADDYFDVRWGDVHVWCLDCRLYASDPEAPDDASKTRIGFEQKEWLKRGMTESDAPVKVVASAMVFRNKVPEDPGWHNVYSTERDELLEFFSSVDGTVVILSGDSHGQRLIHHFEFGELYEINSSGTDFDGGTQGNNDPEHTLVNINGVGGFAMVDLDAAGPDRKLTVRVIAAKDGATLFEKSLPVEA